MLVDIRTCILSVLDSGGTELSWYRVPLSNSFSSKSHWYVETNVWRMGLWRTPVHHHVPPTLEVEVKFVSTHTKGTRIELCSQWLERSRSHSLWLWGVAAILYKCSWRFDEKVKCDQILGVTISGLYAWTCPLNSTTQVASFTGSFSLNVHGRNEHHWVFSYYFQHDTWL